MAVIAPAQMPGPTPSSLSRVVDEIQRLKTTAQADGREYLKHQRYNRLQKLLGVSGQILFEYHTCFLASDLYGLTGDSKQQRWRLGRLWATLDHELQIFWTERTAVVQRGLAARDPGVLSNLNTKAGSPPTKRYLTMKYMTRKVVATASVDQDGYLLAGEDLIVFEELSATKESEERAACSPSTHITGPHQVDGNQDNAPESDAMVEFFADRTRATDVMGILDLIQAIEGSNDDEGRVMLSTTLRNQVSSDGRTLFEYHGFLLLTQAMCTEPELHQYLPQLVHLWARLPQHVKACWTNHTRTLRSGLKSQGNGSPLEYFRLGNYSRRALQYAEMITSALYAIANTGDFGPVTLVQKVLSEIDLQFVPSVEAPKGLAGNLARRTPILNRFANTSYGMVLQGRLVCAMEKVLRYIRKRRAKGHNMKLTGRSNGVRICYDPDVVHAHGIAARLRQVCHRELTSSTNGDAAEPRDRVEWLLRPLIYWNRGNHSISFLAHCKIDQLIPEREIEGYSNHFDSCLAWSGVLLAQLEPLATTKKHEAVHAIMQTFRAHVSLVKDGSKNMLARHMSAQAERVVESSSGGVKHKERVKWWSLGSNNSGFAALLLECFDREWLSHGEYQDLLEQQFYALRQFVLNEDGRDPLLLSKKPRGI